MNVERKKTRTLDIKKPEESKQKRRLYIEKSKNKSE